MPHHRYVQLTFNIHSLLTSLLQEVHSITFQRTPAHSTIKGNEATDLAAEAAHGSGIIVPLPFVASEGNIMISIRGSSLTKRIWCDADHRNRRLYWLNWDEAFSHLQSIASI